VASKETLWPALETGYLDEFGPVDPEVHRVARDVWPRAEHLALDLTGDAALGYRLLKRAVAAISALSAERREQIRDLPPYLFQAYKRLVLAELEKANGHRAGDLLAAQIVGPSQPGAEAVERHILVAQLVSRMDPWTREVFENLTLGYSFAEIGRALDSNPHVVRNRFRLSLQRLAAAVSRRVDVPATEAPLRKSVVESIRRLRLMRVRRFNPSR
jgi:DNA-directed RNA polymerase specialized sigma24 family protein